MMHRKDDFVEFVCDQLAGLGDVRARAMFGGYGIYCADHFFGLVSKGRLYFKTDAATRARYVTAGMGPFAPRPGQVLKNYFEVPVDVLEDDADLIAWAREALGVARA